MKTQYFTHATNYFKLLSFITAALLVLLPSYSQAQVYSPTSSVTDMQVELVFDRATPCTPYTIDWGDGTVDDKDGNATDMCIQVIDTVRTDHTYEESGMYEIAVSSGEVTESISVTVPQSSVSFGINDVETITYVWVDPSEMMADEEYYIYTIKLHSGEEMQLRVAGFTSVEFRNEAFAKVGYTGDVEALLRDAIQTDVPEDDESQDDDAQNDTSNDDAIYKQMITLLQLVVEKLTLLVATR